MLLFVAVVNVCCGCSLTAGNYSVMYDNDYTTVSIIMLFVSLYDITIMIVKPKWEDAKFSTSYNYAILKCNLAIVQ